MGIKVRLEAGIAELRTRNHPWLEPIALVVVTGVFVAALVLAQDLREEARLFPIAVSVLGLVLGILAIVQILLFPRRATARSPVSDLDPDETADLAEGPDIADPRWFWVWFVAFVAAVWAFGFYVGLPVITGLFVLVESRKWLSAVLMGLGTWGYTYWIFYQVFGIAWPNGALL